MKNLGSFVRDGEGAKVGENMCRLSRRQLLGGAAWLGLAGFSMSSVVIDNAFAQTAGDAGELKVGLGTEATTLDPHFYNLTPNSEIAYQIFEYLVSWDGSEHIGHGLAATWRQPSDDSWEFHIRPTITFHDGTPLKADDVVFSIQRAANVPNSPGSFAQFTARIAKVEAVDDLTVLIHTKGPHPYLLSDLTQLAIISRKHGEGAATSDYDSGKAAIGTGPWRYREWVRGDRLILERNPTYWGRAPKWKQVTFKPITSPAARVNALLAGDVDIINQIPSADYARLKEENNVNIAQMTETRLFYFAPDVQRDASPFVTDKNGQPLKSNPLKDVRVRRAISKAMNRDQLVDRIMDHIGEPAGQMVPYAISGASKKLKPEAQDIEGAKQLLKEAGYPDGFGITIHGPNDRYLNDAKVVQAVAQMLTRIGIAVKVETLPKSIYFTKVANYEFSFQYIGSSADTGGGAYALAKYVLHTPDSAKGMGAGNRGHYSSAKVDSLIDEAGTWFDDAKREMLLAEAAEHAIGEDVAIIPLFFGLNTWAMHKPLTYAPRSDGFTLAVEVTPGK